jgi:hypothetical protein
MKNFLIVVTLFILAGSTNAAPVVYTSEALFRADLAALGYAVIHESFEDDAVWADSRNSISVPGSTPSVISQGILWTSNYTDNNIATGDVGGSAPDGTYAIYSLPHGNTTDSGLYCDSAQDPDIPVECYQNDGMKVESETGEALYAFGGLIDTTNSGKVTFLLDGVDINGNNTDNIDNWQREGEPADNWTFVGVIDTDGFLSAELRELRGKDWQQVLLFSDSFYIGVATAPVPVPDIKANGSDVPLQIAFGTLLQLNVSLSANEVAGQAADWWLVAEAPVGWYWYNLDGSWVKSAVPIPTYGGALFDITSMTVLNSSNLPIGSYRIYFGVDTNINGSVDFDVLFADTVDVNIQ